MKCIECEKELDIYDIGFHKKLVNRGATEHTCIPCTCRHFGIPEEKAMPMIRQFQRSGCTLFPPAKDE